MNYLINKFQKSGPFLVPLRLCIGLFLIVTGFNKFLDPQWYTGTTLVTFLQEQLQNGDVAFPFYQSLLSTVIIPNSELISSVILFIELYSGVAIFLGCFTNLALIGAAILNLNLLFSGKVYPSAFLIAAQALLFGMNNGAIFGFDRILSKKIRSRLLVAQRDIQQTSVSHKYAFIALAICFSLFALWSASYIQANAGNLLADTALSTVVLSAMASITFAILAFRTGAQPRQTMSRGSRGSRGSRLSREPIMRDKAFIPANPHMQNSVPEPVLASMPMTIPASARIVNSNNRDVNAQKAHTPSTAQEMNQYATVLVPHNVKRTAGHADIKVQKYKDNLVKIWL